jgi:hypothetical protein
MPLTTEILPHADIITLTAPSTTKTESPRTIQWARNRRRGLPTARAIIIQCTGRTYLSNNIPPAHHIADNAPSGYKKNDQSLVAICGGELWYPAFHGMEGIYGFKKRNRCRNYGVEEI